MLRSFAKDLVSALSYLHANGIIYCDLKPGNVLLNEYSTLKLCDFGLSQKLVDMVHGEDQAADSIDRQGTPYYMAPELFDQGGVFSFASDIYALGSVLYELASGKTPFTNENFTELVRNISENTPTPLAEVSEVCNDFILKLLEKNAALRPKWSTIFMHPWLAGINFEDYDYPEETHFEKYIREKQAYNQEAGSKVSDYDMDINAGASISKLDVTAGVRDDHILRLSLNVKKNINRETGDYIDPTDDNQDVKLDKNMTINLGKKDASQTASEIGEDNGNKSQDNVSQMEEERAKASPVLKSLKFQKSFE